MSLVAFPLRFADSKARGRLVIAALLAALFAFGADCVAIRRSGADVPFSGDADFFANLAKSLATNHGYRLVKSAWPNELNTSRAPLWPAILSVTYRLQPGLPLAPGSRYTNALVHAISAALMVLMAFQVAGTMKGSFVCGAVLAIYPPAIALVVGGFSEIAFLTVLLLGLVLLFEGGKQAMLGSVLCGLSVLARSNYLLLPVFIVLVLSVFARRQLFQKQMRNVLVLSLLFYCFPLLWMVRNYAITGAFPLLSTQEGETLYGANNAVVANNLNEWGYWIFPDEITGEVSKHNLAKTRNELQLNRYYHDKAILFITQNGPSMPRLLLGKLIRGFVPIPWVPLTASYIAFGFRFLLYIAFAYAALTWQNRRQFYSVLLVAMFLLLLVTTLIYYGTYRFTFCLEPLLLPVIAAAYREQRWPLRIASRAGFHTVAPAVPPSKIQQ